MMDQIGFDGMSMTGNYSFYGMYHFWWLFMMGVSLAIIIFAYWFRKLKQATS
jgi:hypothetical protein